MVSRKMKRKTIVDHHFSDFPLSSPATKIRRLQPEEEQPLPTYEPATNDERAIVLFKSPPSSFIVDSNIMSAIKDEVRRSTQSDPVISAEQNDRLAVVPWVPSQFHHNPTACRVSDNVSDADAPELMDMEVEDGEDGNNVSSIHESAESGNAMGGSEELLQWQQQHCLVPQLPHIIATPVTWT